MLNKAMRKIAGPLVRRWITGQVRAAAEGRLGAEWKARYWWLAGKKTWLGAALACACAVLAWAGYAEAATAAGGIVATSMVSWGLLDKAWRKELPDALWASRAYWWFKDHSGDVALVLAGVAGLLTDCSEAWCGAALWAVGGLSVAMAQLGLLAEAIAAPPPATSKATPAAARVG